MQDLTHDQVRALTDTRHAATGVLFPPEGLQPYYDWLIRTVHTLAEASAGNLRVTRDDAAPTAVRIFPGRATLNGAPIVFNGATLDLAIHNNTSVLLAILIDESTPTIAVAPTGDGWPDAPHIKLAAVTLTDGAVTTITDRRFDSLCHAHELAADADTPPLVDNSGGTAASPGDSPSPGTRAIAHVDSLVSAANAIATLAVYASALRTDINDLRAKLRAAGLMRE